MRLIAFVLIVLSAIVCQAQSTATFTNLPAAKGQVILQTLSSRSQLHTVYEQSNQLISSSDRDTTIKQQRQVEVLQTSSGGVPSVQVTYRKATTRKSNKLLSRAEPQPVEGKTYIVRRQDEQLSVVYPNGAEPPRDELAIVKVNMQSVGQPNPLANWLDGRTMQIGEQVMLPTSVAKQLLGSWLGESALRVTLKMVKLISVKDQQSAVFDIQMAGDQESGRPPMSSAGQVTVGVANCRTLKVAMDAEVDLNEQRGPDGAQFTVSNTGEIRIELTASYR